jgi:hypothetical protein
MRTNTFILLAAILSAAISPAAVKLTALTIHGTEAAGKIPGVGGHRFKTTQHGGQPAIFLVKGSDLEGPIINGPNTAKTVSIYR